MNAVNKMFETYDMLLKEIYLCIPIQFAYFVIFEQILHNIIFLYSVCISICAFAVAKNLAENSRILDVYNGI